MRKLTFWGKCSFITSLLAPMSVFWLVCWSVGLSSLVCSDPTIQGFPKKGARLPNAKKSIFSNFFPNYHHWVTQKYLLNFEMRASFLRKSLYVCTFVSSARVQSNIDYFFSLAGLSIICGVGLVVCLASFRGVGEVWVWACVCVCVCIFLIWLIV